MDAVNEDKLTLEKVRAIRARVRNKRGEVLMEKRFRWDWRGEMGQHKQKHWTLDFDIQRWEWYIELCPQKGEWDNGMNPDPTWEKSEFVFMWLGNRDPNRFLVAIEIVTVQDLTRFLDAFKLDYYFETETVTQ